MGYRYYDLKQTNLLFPFGHGLSYTSYSYSNLKLDREIFDCNESEISLSVTITNTGAMAGAETVQLYIGAFDAIVKRPPKELKSFQKVFLNPGESKELTFSLTKRDFSFYYEVYHEWYVPKGKYQILIGASACDIRLSTSLFVVPQKEHLKLLSGWSKVKDLRQTASGEAIYQQLHQKMKAVIPEHSIYMSRADLENNDKMNELPLRRIILFTNGMINNDELLAVIDEANKDR